MNLDGMGDRDAKPDRNYSISHVI